MTKEQLQITTLLATAPIMMLFTFLGPIGVAAYAIEYFGTLWGWLVWLPSQFATAAILVLYKTAMDKWEESC